MISRWSRRRRSRAGGPAPELVGDDELAALAVPAAEYDRRYFLHGCIGADEWRQSEGREPKGFYAGMLHWASFRPGMALLDVGTGRGELVRVAAGAGAELAVGVDYSPDAVDLARQTLDAEGASGAQILLADARRLPVDDRRFDLVTLLNVVEHLTKTELDHTLRECRRGLRPGGRVFVHTASNRFVYDVVYRAQRVLLPSRRRRWPAEPRSEGELKMHVNEQTVGALRGALRAAGFASVRARPGSWIHERFVPDRRPRRTYHRLAAVPGLRRLAVFDIYAEAVNPG